MPTVPTFLPVRPLEQRLWDAVARAGTSWQREIAVDTNDLTDNTVRGDFLAWLLSAEGRRLAPLLARLALTDAQLVGRLDMRGLRLALTPRFIACYFDDGIVLDDATIVGFEILGGALSSLYGDRLSASGSLLIRAPTADESPTVPPEPWRSPVVAFSIRLCGANIRGNLDLRQCRIRCDSLRGRGIGLFADGAHVTGNALLGDGFSCDGEVRLSGCEITRNLDLSGARLRARRTYAFSALAAHIGGNAYFCDTQAVQQRATNDEFSAYGTVQLAGTKIDGEFNCNGGNFFAPSFVENPPLPVGPEDRTLALRANGLRVGGPLRLRDNFHPRGVVNLVNAHIGGDMQCHGAFFDHAGVNALVADGIEVGGTLFFDRQRAPRPRVGGAPAAMLAARTNGFLCLRYATIAQGLYLDNVVFMPPVAVPPTPGERPKGNCGLAAAFATIHGSFMLHGMRRDPEPPLEHAGVTIDLMRAKADEIEDDRGSWSRVRQLNFTGFEYGAIRNLGPDDLWRVALLNRHYAFRAVPSVERARRFEPQPYLWLAKIMQQSGYERIATAILILLEKNRTALGDYTPWGRRWRRFLSWSIYYGYEPLRAVRPLAIWTVLSAIVFWTTPSGVIVSSKDPAPATAAQAARPKDATDADSNFSPFFYALDSLVPFVDLHQRSQWTVRAPSLDFVAQALTGQQRGTLAAGRGVALWALVVSAFGILNPFFGWALAALLIAGVTGLVRKGGGGS